VRQGSYRRQLVRMAAPKLDLTSIIVFHKSDSRLARYETGQGPPRLLFEIFLGHVFTEQLMINHFLFNQPGPKFLYGGGIRAKVGVGDHPRDLQGPCCRCWVGAS